MGDEQDGGERIDERGRPYIGVFFECCGVYSRIYRTKKGDAYAGWCPRCAKPLRVKCGEGGTDQRIFRAG